MYGYGKDDIFSPLQADTSFANNPYNSQREAENIPELIPTQNTLIMDKNMGEIMCQMKNSFFENALPRSKANGTKEQLVFNSKMCEDSLHKTLPNEFLSMGNCEDVIFGNSYDKDFPIEVGSKRSRSSLQTKKDYFGRNFNTKTSNMPLKSKQAKRHYSDSLQNYVHSRSEICRSKEKNDKLCTKTTPFPNNNLLKCFEKKVVEVIDLETADSSDSNYEKNSSGSTTVDQSRLLENGLECMSERICTSKRNAYDYNIDEVSICMPSSQILYNQAQQIQVNITEQLIKETISFEFDAIRQLLYLHHILLYRHLNKLEIFENQNSSNSEFMLRVIEELLQENRLLKKAISSHQRRA